MPGKPISAKLWINHAEIPVELDYELKVTMSTRRLFLEAEVRPEGIELGVRGGPLGPGELLGLIHAAHRLGKTRDALEIVARYPVRLRLLGVSIKIRPEEKEEQAPRSNTLMPGSQ